MKKLIIILLAAVFTLTSCAKPEKPLDNAPESQNSITNQKIKTKVIDTPSGRIDSFEFVDSNNNTFVINEYMTASSCTKTVITYHTSNPANFKTNTGNYC